LSECGWQIPFLFFPHRFSGGTFAVPLRTPFPIVFGLYYHCYLSFPPNPFSSLPPPPILPPVPSETSISHLVGWAIVSFLLVPPLLHSFKAIPVLRPLPPTTSPLSPSRHFGLRVVCFPPPPPSMIRGSSYSWVFPRIGSYLPQDFQPKPDRLSPPSFIWAVPPPPHVTFCNYFFLFPAPGPRLD